MMLKECDPGGSPSIGTVKFGPGPPAEKKAQLCKLNVKFFIIFFFLMLALFPTHIL